MDEPTQHPAEIRMATPEEVKAAEAEFAGLDPIPLVRVTFYGHLVHNPAQVGTLAPAFTGHEFDAHQSIPGPVLELMLPRLLRHLAGLLDGVDVQIEEVAR